MVLSARDLWIMAANSDLSGSNPPSALSVAWPASHQQDCETALKQNLLQLTDAGYIELSVIPRPIPRARWHEEAGTLDANSLSEGFCFLPQRFPAPLIACTASGIRALDDLLVVETQTPDPGWELDSDAWEHAKVLRDDLASLSAGAVRDATALAETMAYVSSRIEIAGRWTPWLEHERVEPALSPMVAYASAALIPDGGSLLRNRAFLSVHEFVRKKRGNKGGFEALEAVSLPATYADVWDRSLF